MELLAFNPFILKRRNTSFRNILEESFLLYNKTTVGDILTSYKPFSWRFMCLHELRTHFPAPISRRYVKLSKQSLKNGRPPSTCQTSPPFFNPTLTSFTQNPITPPYTKYPNISRTKALSFATLAYTTKQTAPSPPQAPQALVLPPTMPCAFLPLIWCP